MKAEDARKLLQAYVDGELDPAACVELEAALAADAGLRASHERLRSLSSAIRENAEYFRAPARLQRNLFVERKERKTFLLPAFATLAVAAIALTLLLQRPTEGIEAELLSSHGRATLGQRMIDVASSDRHTVKPWLSARLPYSPPVLDFADKGFPLEGARVDYVGGRSVAVLVYGRHKHVIEVFVWPAAAGSSARKDVRDGLNFEAFSRDGMQFWLVSDLERDELAELASLL